MSADSDSDSSESAGAGMSASARSHPSPPRGADQGGGCFLRSSLAALALLAIGCAGDRAPSSCADSLAGLWQSGDRRYHVVDAAGAIEIFPLADSRGDLDRPLPGAARSASYARLERQGERLSGYGQQFRAEGDRVCRVRWTVTGRCASGALELEIAEPGAVDFADCSQRGGHQQRSLAMRRIRRL